MEITPKEIYWNVFKYLRHPVAEIISDAHTKQYKNSHDRGSADAYYSRNMNPHIILYRLKNKLGKYTDIRMGEGGMTKEEIDEYYVGYYDQTDRK